MTAITSKPKKTRLNRRTKDEIIKDIKKNKYIYAFVIPALIYFVVFRYIPLYFIQVAFKDYRITRAISECDWVGMKHFARLFTTPAFMNSLKNTIIISFYKIVLGFPAPIILALLLNEMKSLKIKKISQTCIYIPHFIAWSIMSGIMYNLLSVDGGVINTIIQQLGGESVFFLGDPKYFRGVLVLSDIWKETGWGTILYLAAVSAIDPNIYEAAIVDGAGRFRRLLHITLPGIKSTIVVLLIIRIGNILNVGFEQVYVLSNPMVQNVGDVIDTYVYRVGLEQGRQSLATAAGVFKMVVAGIMVYGSDRFSKSVGENGLF